MVRVQDPDGTWPGSGVRTIAKAGLDVGGNHIDAVLAEWAAREAGVPEGDAVGYNRVFRLLLASAEAAKVTLTSRDRAVIEATDAVTGARYRARISQQEFNRLLRGKDVLGRAGRGLRKALDDAAARGYPSGEISAAIAGGQELHDHIQHDYAIRHVAAHTGNYEFETLVQAGTAYPTAEPVKSLTIKAIHPGQRRLGIAIYELAHATYRDASADLEIIFDADGGARTIAVGAQQRQEQAMLWLNEDSPTFLEADPPAAAGTDRFRLDFRIDAQKRLTVSAFDLKRRIWILDRQPVVRLA